MPKAVNHATLSGIPVDPVYDCEPGELGEPGQFPYTRGIHPGMYRTRSWTMRQFAGFGTPAHTNERFRHLLGAGQTGLSVAFDLPTLMGVDPDHPSAAGEAGKCGVSIASIDDMEELFRGVPLGEITVSMTINAPAAVIWAMYLVAAERQGAGFKSLSGTLQNDILKEYIAQKEFIYPPRPSMRLVTDVIEYATRHVPRYNPISISGYHIREAGSTAVQELAFTLRDGIEYVEWALRRGLAVDSFAPRLSFFFNSHNDFFEEIAKFRAARKMWAEIIRERFGATDEKSWKLRFHAQTAGCSLTRQQPYNNVVRTTIQALAAVLGGAQSLHTNSLDEAYALPSESAATLALRTQQVIANESGVVAQPDPLGGSCYLEHLTAEVERRALDYIERIDALGGMLRAVEQGYPQAEIAASSYLYQRQVEAGERTIIGVNASREADEPEPLLLRIPGDDHAGRLEKLKKERNGDKVARALDDLRLAAAGEANTMPFILEGVRARATLGEICDALRDVFGTYEESSVL